MNGKLPVSINLYYPAGTGLSTPKLRLGYYRPESCGMDSQTLLKIDSICQAAIKTKATPGCQVLVAKDGYIVYNKAFGFNTYDKKKKNTTDNIYDIASITKIAATLPAVMMLYDQQHIALDSPIVRYSYALRETDKQDITVKELLLHTSGLKASFSFFHENQYPQTPGSTLRESQIHVPGQHVQFHGRRRLPGCFPAFLYSQTFPGFHSRLDFKLQIAAPEKIHVQRPWIRVVKGHRGRTVCHPF